MPEGVPGQCRQVFQTQTSQTLTMCCCGNGGQPGGRSGPQESQPRVPQPPAPSSCLGLDSPCQAPGCPAAESAACGLQGWATRLALGPSRPSEPRCLLPAGSRSGCGLGHPRPHALPVGSAATAVSGRAPPAVAPAPGGRGPGPCVSCGVHWVGSEGSSTCARGGFQRVPQTSACPM